MQATRDLFETLAALSDSERESYLEAHPEWSADAVRMVRELLGAEDDSDSLPCVENLVPLTRSSSAPELKAGDRLGPYRLVRRLGSGGMGIVFEAVREEGEISLRCAIKVLHPELCTPEFLLQLRQEAAKLATLRHPNIARLLDWGIDQTPTPYCVLEYIDGKSVTAWCDHQALSRKARLLLFLDVCAAVAFAHRNLVAHLDLKPENILVNDSGGARLVDFGIARTLVRESPSESEATPRAYSARYASPEQINGGTLSARSDIYSLGVVLRELLREPPKAHGNKLAARSLPYEIEAICSRAAAADPDLRYSTVQEFQQDLRSYLAQRPVQAAPKTPIYRACKYFRRNALQLVAATVVAVALLASVTSWQLHRRADREHQRAERLRAAVLKLSSTLLFPLEDEMRNLPGATPARMLAVQTGLEYLQNLSADANIDPSLAVEIARAYTKLGDIQGNPSNANLGDEKGARQSYEIARHMLVDLRDPDSRYAYGLLLTHEGDLISANGDNQTAEQMYKDAIGAFFDLIHAGRGDARVKEALESGLNDLADEEAGEGRAPLARAHYDQALELARQLLQLQPDNAVYQRNLARCLSRQGNLEWDAGRWQMAANAYRGSLDIYDRLLRRQPDNIKVRHSWIAGANNVAAADEHLNRLAEALDLYTRAGLLAARTVEIDPQNIAALRDRQVGYSNITRVLLSLNQLPGAESSCRRELALAQSLWKMNQEDATARDDLAGSKEHLAEVQSKMHGYSAAIASEQEALLLLKANLETNRSAESLVAVVDGLVRLAHYDIDLGEANPASAPMARKTALNCLAELHRMEPHLRPANAEDKERSSNIRALEIRLNRKAR